MNFPQRFAIRINTEGNSELLFSADDRAEITHELGVSSIVWLPQTEDKVNKAKSTHNLTLETSILLFTGLSFLFGKPFIDGFANEMGKDAWGFIKGIVPRIWKKQSDRVYSLTSRTNVIFELGDNFVAIQFTASMLKKGEASIDELETRFQECLLILAQQWDEIVTEVENMAKVSPKGSIYWVRLTPEGRNIARIPSWKMIGG